MKNLSIKAKELLHNDNMKNFHKIFNLINHHQSVLSGNIVVMSNEYSFLGYAIQKLRYVHDNEDRKAQLIQLIELLLDKGCNINQLQKINTYEGHKSCSILSLTIDSSVFDYVLSKGAKLLDEEIEKYRLKNPEMMLNYEKTRLEYVVSTSEKKGKLLKI